MTAQMFEADHAAWAEARLQALKAGDGWLNLTDRTDVAAGTHSVGQGADNDLRISAGPDHLGTLVVHADGSGTLDSGEGPQAFEPYPDNPPRLTAKGLLLELSTLEGQTALRVRDLHAPAIAAFPGIEAYPLDPAWRVTADWEALEQAETKGIGTVKGIDTSVKITHRARFTHEGQEVVLLPTHWKKGKPMFVIRDKTSGPETYGASRFLIGEVEGDKVILDFNRAFNPPCAYTYYAVCPLPPKENVMGFPIRAGEKKPLE